MGPNFECDIMWPQGRFMDSKDLPPTKFDLHKILKIHEIFLENPQTLFCFCFTMYTKRKCSQLEEKMGAM